MTAEKILSKHLIEMSAMNASINSCKPYILDAMEEYAQSSQQQPQVIELPSWQEIALAAMKSSECPNEENHSHDCGCASFEEGAKYVKDFAEKAIAYIQDKYDQLQKEYHNCEAVRKMNADNLFNCRQKLHEAKQSIAYEQWRAGVFAEWIPGSEYVYYPKYKAWCRIGAKIKRRYTTTELYNCEEFKEYLEKRRKEEAK